MRKEIKMSTTQITREQLIKKKEQLLKSLDEVTKTLKHLDKMVYKGKLEKATISFDEKMILIQDYISKNAITEKELADRRYSELEKEYRESLAEKEKLQDELTERRRRSLMIGWFVYSRIYFSIVTNRNSA